MLDAFMLGATGVGALGVILALTRRTRELEAGLAAQRESGEHLAKLARAVEYAADAVLIMDARGFIEFVNPAFTTITGYQPAEVIGHTPRKLIWSGAQDSAFYETLWIAILSGETWRGMLTHCKKSGERYVAEETISAIRDGSGTITHLVAVQRDVTERRRAESCAHLVGSMAGEFNNLLTPILGFSDLLRSSLDGQDQRAGQAAEIHRAAERAAELLRQVLQCSGRRVSQDRVMDWRGTETVLLVDDDDIVRTVAARILRSAGYVVVEAADADDALDAVEQHRDALGLLITDVLMPKMSGRGLAEEVLLRVPAAKVLYVSGCVSGALDPGCPGATERAFLPKPFTPGELLSCVRRLLDQN